MSESTFAPLEHVELSMTDSVATIALNRPDKRNAINQALHRDLTSALRAVDRNSSVRALLITGRGPGFCAGQDLHELGAARAEPGFRIDEHVRTTFNRTVLTIRSLRMPVIAAINGVAAGAGWSLALAADLRIAAADATFTQAFTRIGLVPDTGATWLLPQLVGPARALQLAFLNERLDAEKALDWGLVNEVVPAEELASRSAAVAHELATMPTAALAMTRRAIYRSAAVTLEDALEYEAQLQQRAAATNDHVEGLTSLLERRDPVFTGR